LLARRFQPVAFSFLLVVGFVTIFTLLRRVYQKLSFNGQHETHLN
jgi:hypothetical protein